MVESRWRKAPHCQQRLNSFGLITRHSPGISQACARLETLRDEGLEVLLVDGDGATEAFFSLPFFEIEYARENDQWSRWTQWLNSQPLSMSLLSLPSTAGPSPTTLQALSDYCASSDSSFSDTDSSYSFLADAPNVPSPKLVSELPEIIVQADQFQSTSVQEKMLKASTSSARSGFTRQAPSTRRNREVSTQKSHWCYMAIFEGFPPSPSDCFFNDGYFVQSSTPVHIGLGKLRLSPPRTPHKAATTPRAAPATKTRSSDGAVPSSQYAGIGLGLPSRFSSNSASSRFMSGFTISSVRSLSTALSIFSSTPYPNTLFSELPRLNRHTGVEPNPATKKLVRWHV
ncbi:hypothetical protein C8R47DRAFT_1232177 [Mycena vitilis]|nr:hypothetical protein C8R47DRAFT_1232177 [Mycena vitilis]